MKAELLLQGENLRRVGLEQVLLADAGALQALLRAVAQILHRLDGGGQGLDVMCHESGAGHGQIIAGFVRKS